jgi:hypothetical protein
MVPVEVQGGTADLIVCLAATVPLRYPIESTHGPGPRIARAHTAIPVTPGHSGCGTLGRT